MINKAIINPKDYKMSNRKLMYIYYTRSEFLPKIRLKFNKL